MENDLLVTTKYGTLRGTKNTLYDDSEYYSFKGIPYAQPPVGKLRFLAPQPPKPWVGVYDATKHRGICPQIDMGTMTILEGDEDCLYLNVYTKSLNHNSKQPVMVFIHGGAFKSGSGDDTSFGPKYLIQHDVVLVTFNYRLEAFGFLCLDTPEVPGNAGMKDQIAVLRWVQDNIKLFGGDPDNVCLFGESAGGVSVTFHMISPMSKGLFHKAIAQSGSCFQDWACAFNAKERSFRAGKYLGKQTDNGQEMLEYLQSLPAVSFANITNKINTKDEACRGLTIHFTPNVEKRFDNVEAFLDEEPTDLIVAKRFNRVPFIIGYNSHEGMISLRSVLSKADFYNKQPEFIVPRSIDRNVSEDKAIDIGNRIMRFYLGERVICKEATEGIIDMQSDMHFIYHTHRFAYFYALCEEPLYLYRFCCDTELNLVKLSLRLKNIKGTCHADELLYLFNRMHKKDPYETNEDLRNVINNVTKLWTDFAKTGNPTPDGSSGVTWTPFTNTNKAFLDINEKLTIGFNAERERVDFWNRLYFEAGIPCEIKSSL